MKGIKKMIFTIGFSAVAASAMLGFAGCGPRVVKTFEEAANEYDAFLQKLENERNFTYGYEVHEIPRLILVDGDKIKITFSNSERVIYYNSDGGIITYNSEEMVVLETSESDKYVKSLISELNNPSWKSYNAKRNELSGEIEVLQFAVGEGEFMQEHYQTRPMKASINETEAKIQIGDDDPLNYRFYNMGSTVVNIPEEYVEEIRKEKEKAEKEEAKKEEAEKAKEQENESNNALTYAFGQISDAFAATYVMRRL